MLRQKSCTGFYVFCVNICYSACRAHRQMCWVKALGCPQKQQGVRGYVSSRVINSSYALQNVRMALTIPYCLLCAARRAAGTLRGFDEFVNMVLDDVTEYEVAADGSRTATKLDSILLNGSNVACLVPGSSPEDAAGRGIGPKSSA